MSTPPRRRSSESTGGFPVLPEWTRAGTRLVHGARPPDRNAGSVVPPIYLSTTFRYPAEFSEAGPEGLRMYSRLTNPTQEVAAELVRGLEGADAARVFGSGMGAISTTLLGLLSPGDELVALDTLYGGTLDLLRDVLPRFGIRVRSVDRAAAREPERAISPATRVAYLESPTNPLLDVHDIRRWATAADAVGALLVVDNTFATPINQNPLALGADLVVHSATKYLGGHHDVLAGAIAGPEELLERLDPTREVLGASLDPMGAYLLARGVRTLHLRVARQNENARAVAEALRGHRNVRRVNFPGWADPESEEIAARQMRGRGGMLSVELSGGSGAVERFLHGLAFVQVASSLGGLETLASVPAITSHRHLAPAERRALGISDVLIRFSLGVEETDDLVRDFRQALDRI